MRAGRGTDCWLIAPAVPGENCSQVNPPLWSGDHPSSRCLRFSAAPRLFLRSHSLPLLSPLCVCLTHSVLPGTARRLLCPEDEWALHFPSPLLFFCRCWSEENSRRQVWHKEVVCVWWVAMLAFAPTHPGIVKLWPLSQPDNNQTNYQTTTRSQRLKLKRFYLMFFHPLLGLLRAVSSLHFCSLYIQTKAAVIKGTGTSPVLQMILWWYWPGSSGWGFLVA